MRYQVVDSETEAGRLYAKSDSFAEFKLKASALAGASNVILFRFWIYYLLNSDLRFFASPGFCIPFVIFCVPCGVTLAATGIWGAFFLLLAIFAAFIVAVFVYHHVDDLVS